MKNLRLELTKYIEGLDMQIDHAEETVSYYRSLADGVFEYGLGTSLAHLNTLTHIRRYLGKILEETKNHG